MSRWGLLLARETSLAWGRGGGPLVTVGFFGGVATLLPLAIGPEPDRLAAIATGAAWVALALASLLSLDRLFERDFEDGALDLLALAPTPPTIPLPPGIDTDTVKTAKKDGEKKSGGKKTPDAEKKAETK